MIHLKTAHSLRKFRQIKCFREAIIKTFVFKKCLNETETDPVFSNLNVLKRHWKGRGADNAKFT